MAALAALILIALGVRYFIFENIRMKTDAMSAAERSGGWAESYAGDESYEKGKIVVINKLMDVSEIKRGSVVYANFTAIENGKLLRRVAAVEGDEIITREDGNKYIVPGDGSKEINIGAAEGLAGGILQKDQYVLLCDDLSDPNALDSRQLGLVTSINFIGVPR